MTKRYYFSGKFSTSAYACYETTRDLTEAEIKELQCEGELQWDWGRRGEITDVQFEEVEEV